MRTHYIRSLASVVALSVSIVGIGGTAHAQSKLGDTAPSTVTMPLTLSCANLSPRAQSYVRQHHLCGTTSANSTIVPYTTVSGNCGTATLSARKWGTGVAEFDSQVNSTQGNMIYVSYSIGWGNATTGAGSSIGVGGTTFSQNWTHMDTAGTGAGAVTGRLNGLVATLWYGGQCYGVTPGPWASVNI